MTNDLVSDMLTRIRNASLAKHNFTRVKYSKLNLAILHVLKGEGYIKDYSLHSEENKQFHPFTSERDWDNDNRKLILSTTERAYLEVLLDVPQKITFEHADKLMQGLTTLSPRNLQKTLECCQNVKVKRLFFWFADRQNYVWLGKLNRESITLGSGNRMLIKGGKLDTKYKITVPEWL